MAVRGFAWMCMVFVVLWSDSIVVRGALPDKIDASGLLNEDTKIWQSSEHTLDGLADDDDSLAHESDKREWNIQPEDLDPALQEDVKRKWGNSMKVWGKRNGMTSEEEKRAWNNNLRVWGKRNGLDLPEEELEKRRWSSDNLRVWGKREEPAKKWGNMNTMKVWGKRGEPDNKRKWSNNMRVWGKRAGSELMDNEKRKWDQSMRVWGKRDGLTEEEKRRWDNQFKVWGKRHQNLGEEALASDDEDPTADKKAWDSNMRVWGKRSIHKRSLESVNEDFKRAWDTGSMRVWGKRRNRNEEGPKRSWRNNSMRVWGKRSVDQADQDAFETEKRKWDSQLRTWGKRKWDGNLRTWGKRTAQDLSSAELLETLEKLYSKHEDDVYRR